MGLYFLLFGSLDKNLRTSNTFEDIWFIPVSLHILETHQEALRISSSDETPTKLKVSCNLKWELREKYFSKKT